MNGVFISLAVIGLCGVVMCSVGCTSKEAVKYCASVPHAGTICTKDVEEYMDWMHNPDALCEQIPMCAAGVQQQKREDARTEELRHEIKLRQEAEKRLQEVTESCHCARSRECD